MPCVLSSFSSFFFFLLSFSKMVNTSVMVRFGSWHSGLGAVPGPPMGIIPLSQAYLRRQSDAQAHLLRFVDERYCLECPSRIVSRLNIGSVCPIWPPRPAAGGSRKPEGNETCGAGSPRAALEVALQIFPPASRFVVVASGAWRISPSLLALRRIIRFRWGGLKATIARASFRHRIKLEMQFSYIRGGRPLVLRISWLERQYSLLSCVRPDIAHL